MPDIRILIADDEERMRKLISDFLKRQKYSIFEAENGNAAYELFVHENQSFDLVILDVMMPGLNGWELLREIRKTSDVPAIILTAKSGEADELYGFNLGADEYITKPFSPMILVARVNALLKRTQGPKEAKLVFNGLEIDSAGHIVKVGNKVIDLTPKEFELLCYLASNEGIALSREQILNSVWNYDYLGDSRTVDTHIKKLRLKLGSHGEFIQTVRGLGYKFGVIK